jgi:trigger factor
LKVSRKEQPQREAVLTITLESEEVEPYLERAYRKIVQQANIPGFRKGKAPRRIIEQLYGREHLLHEAMDFLVPEVTNKAVEEASLELGGTPSVSLDEMEPVSITARVPLTPTVDLGVYRDIRVPKEQAKVSKKEIDEVLERMRLEVAPWEPVEEPVQLDDLLNVSVKGWVGDEEILNTERSDFVPREGSQVPAPGFAEQLVGMSAHETRSFSIAVPAEFDYAQVAGKTVHFEVENHIVKRRQPGKIDDEFAKGVGAGYDSLADLVKKVKADLVEEAEASFRSKHQEESLGKLVEMAKVELSPLIIEHELEHTIEHYQQSMKTGQVSMEQYQQYIRWAGKSEEEIRDDARPEALERIMRMLVLRELATQESLEVGDDDLREEIDRMAAVSNDESDEVRKMFESDDTLDSLRSLLLNRKAIEFLTSTTAQSGAASAKAKAKIKKKAPSTGRKKATAE